jgi:toxin YoeB
MHVVWTRRALAEFRDLETNNPDLAVRIVTLIEAIKTTPFSGIGKPEPLKYDLAGWWSRRIDRQHRLVYRVTGNPPVLTIAQCRQHY